MSKDLPEKLAGRAALSSALKDMADVGGGATSGPNAAGGAVGIVLGLGVQGLVTRGTMGLGLFRVLESSTGMLVGSLRGSFWILGVGAQGDELILMSEGSLLPDAREGSPFWLLMMAMIGSYTQRGGTEETLELLLHIAYKGSSILSYLTWAILT